MSRLLEEQNSDWTRLDCEIEDLMSWALLEEFVNEDPRRCRRQPQRQAGGHHLELTPDAKSALYRFVHDHAILRDMERVVEALKSLRFYLGLDPEGE